MRARLGWVSLYAVASLALAGCRAAAPAAGDGALEIVVPTETATLDPRFCTRALDVKVTRLVHAGLVGLHPDTLEPVPLVAEGWQLLDERSLEVTLRPGLRFHSGRALTPEDVCTTLLAVADPAVGSPHRAVAEAIGSCEALSGRRLMIRLSRPRATLLTDLELPVLRADEARAAPRPAGGMDGLGPYAIGRATPGEVVLSPAATGIGPLPRHPVVVRTVRDENARALRLLAGRSDVAPNAISPALLSALDGQEGLQVVARPGANVTYLLLHNERPPLDRPEVRRALAQAIDRETIVATLLAGRGLVARGLFPPGHWAHASDVTVPRFDPQAARPLLASAPPFTLLTSTDRARMTIARAIAQMLRDAGAQVRVVALDLGALLDRLDAGDFQMATLQMPELTEPNVLQWFFHPRGVPGEGPGKNRARYREQRAGELLDEAAVVSDRRVRQQLYQRLAQLMASDLPVIPLWHEDQVAVVSSRASGFVPSAEGRWLSIAGL